MDVKELESKTVSELKEMAKEAGISGISSMKKADLVSALAKGAPAPEAEPAKKPPVQEAVPAQEAQEEEPVPAQEAQEEEAGPAPEAQKEEAGPAPEAPEKEAGPAQETPVEEPPAPEEGPEEKPAPEKKAKPSPEPPKPGPAPRTKPSRIQQKYDIPTLKQEKRGLKSQIQAAIAAQDFKKVKELRNRKKELRRLLNRA